MKDLNFFTKVYREVKKIPPGFVETYGDIAKRLGTKDSRKVGWALHANKSKDVPCHRVVDKTGRLAPNFAFDGARGQKRRLESEGVTFTDNMHVDLDKHLWTKTK
jgi:methylated-DNA-protein-cysteine methyltransferase-like protein